MDNRQTAQAYVEGSLVLIFMPLPLNVGGVETGSEASIFVRIVGWRPVRYLGLLLPRDRDSHSYGIGS